MISKFFIDRPVFSTVLSLLITLGGLISIFTLPVAQFPEIVPPSIQISASYPGASAEVVASSVAGPIEQQLSGAKNLIYFNSQCSNDGGLKMNVFFEIGSDQDMAAVEVQNRLAIAQPRLPQEVTRSGVTVTKTSTNLLCVVTLKSKDPQYDEVYLSNYATINVVDALKRVPGAGDVLVYGAKDYAMRLWVNPDRLTARGLTVTDVANAVREQNATFAAGRIGQRPSGSEVELTIPVLTRGRLENPEDYENIIIRANADGSMVRLKDVARVELGSQSYDLFGRLDSTPTTMVLFYLQTGANAINTAKGIEAAMENLQTAFPEGVSYEIPYNTTKFIEVSIEAVVHTLLEAVVLVLLVVFIFLQSWRATLIPLLAVPVAIIGTFAGMLALGFSINTLTLFGMVLAIGIVVDEAIVVVENVERIMHDEKLPVRDATIKAMNEVTGPVIAIVLVLSAVFLPVAFLGGLTGRLYQQFAVTIAVSVAISGLVALTLSPALCRLLLKPAHGPKFIFFRWFNAAFDAMTSAYTAAVRKTIRFGLISIAIFGALLFSTWHFMKNTPTGFIPDEDQGYVICAVVLPDGASIERTDRVVKQVEEWFGKHPAVKNTIALGGLDLFGGGINATNAATLFIPLKPWDERKDRSLGVRALIMGAWKEFGGLKEAMVITVNPPSISGLGARSGFEFQLEAKGTSDIAALGAVSDAFVAKLRERPEMTGVNATLRIATPQFYVDLDRDRAKAMGVPINEVFTAMQAYLGSLYVNDFDKFGRVWRVQLQAEPEFRKTPDDIGRIFVRSQAGEMVPLAGLINVQLRTGPNQVSKFNGFPSVQITGSPTPGYSTGDAMNILKEVAAKELPSGYGYEWSGQSYQEIKAGNQAPIVMAFGLLVVFLVLAAQYEAWALPVAVLMAVPLGIFGAFAAVNIRGIENDLFFQIGLLTLVGLAAKNAILIVEFCVVLRKQGKTLTEAAIEAARLRFRPILMTSLAFILGVVPLVISTGAGAAGRHSIGTGVLGGMLAATVLAVFFVPLFYVIVQGLSEKLGGAPAANPEAPASTTPPPPAASH
jgi:hydrophobe/amphiphile efflux-1 (HAE1) family protein